MSKIVSTHVMNKKLQMFAMSFVFLFFLDLKKELLKAFESLVSIPGSPFGWVPFSKSRFMALSTNIFSPNIGVLVSSNIINRFKFKTSLIRQTDATGYLLQLQLHLSDVFHFLWGAYFWILKPQPWSSLSPVQNPKALAQCLVASKITG